MLAVLYLVFNEGYAATAGDALVRGELCDEAIRLAKLLAVLMPDEPEVFGLLALMLTGSPVVLLNRAVAVAMAEGYERGLELMDDLPLDRYHLFHAARADLLRRLERHEEAAAAYRRALQLTDSAAERAFLARRLKSLASA